MVSPGVRFIFMCVCFLWRAERAVWRWGGGRVIVTDDHLWAGIVCEPSAAKLFLCHPPQSSGNASYRCSMSSSADFSDEDDFSQKSGSASPAPGDTLPWNLPKHERSKRKIQGGSVLDPAERAVLRIAGKWGRGWRGDQGGRNSPLCSLVLYLQADALGRNLSQVGEEMTMFTSRSASPPCTGD